MLKYWKWMLVLFVAILSSCKTTQQPVKQSLVLGENPKREFRGAWIQTAFQGEYKEMSVKEMRRSFIRKLDFLEKCGINAIIFQVRPEADAFYRSKLEPWSRFYTGEQGRAPEGNFDVMAFLIEECHKRNMEFHAWLNPYRISTAGNTKFADSHIYHQHPEWFVTYYKQILFDPGLPQSRQFICKVVKDIVSRYDVDAIHMDDYFYPYPAAGQFFPDDKSFRKYGLAKGYKPEQKADWRRENVNKLTSIYGVPQGNLRACLCRYNNDFYFKNAFTKEDWIDYNIPQIYWEMGHPLADYTTLIKWWSKHAYGGHLYIGQDVARTMKADQLTKKMRYERRLPHIAGNCFWPANEILWNNKGVADSLQRHYHRYPALIPAYTNMHNRAPEEVKKLKTEWTADGFMLHWKAEQSKTNPELAWYFVVYRFDPKEEIDLNNPAKIVGITRNTFYKLPYDEGRIKYRYVVTAVDRFHNESLKGKSKKVKL